MQTTLPPEWIATLVKMPETGMGYQKVDITLLDGSVLRSALVYNCEILDHAESSKCLTIGIRSIKMT